MLRLAKVTSVRKARICVCGEPLVDEFCPHHGTDIRVDSFFVESLFSLDSSGKTIPLLSPPITISLPENQFLSLFSRRGSFLTEKMPGKIIYEVNLAKTASPAEELITDFMDQIEVGDSFFGEFEVQSFQIRSSGTRIHFFCSPTVRSPSTVRFSFTYLPLRRLSNYISWRLTQTKADRRHIISSLCSTRSTVYSQSGAEFRIMDINWDERKRLPSKISVVSPDGEKQSDLFSTSLYQNQEHFMVGTRTETEALMGLESIAQRFVDYFLQYLSMRHIQANYRRLRHDKELFNDYKGKRIIPNAQVLASIGAVQNERLLQNPANLTILTNSTESSALLLIACSATKDGRENVLPAILRYQGISFVPLKALLLANHWPIDVDVMILSAKYGLLQPLDPIPFYDERLTAENATEKRELIRQQVSSLELARYTVCMLNLPKGYLDIVEPFESQLQKNNCEILKKRARASDRNDGMIKWLLRIANEGIG